MHASYGHVSLNSAIKISSYYFLYLPINQKSARLTKHAWQPVIYLTKLSLQMASYEGPSDDDSSDEEDSSATLF